MGDRLTKRHHIPRQILWDFFSLRDHQVPGILRDGQQHIAVLIAIHRKLLRIGKGVPAFIGKRIAKITAILRILNRAALPTDTAHRICQQPHQ